LWRSLDPAASARRMGRGPMANSDEDGVETIPTDDPEAIVAFWKGAFAKFLYAKTESEAAAALAGALRSEWVLPDDFRLALADMLEGGSVHLTETSWTLRMGCRRPELAKRLRGGEIKTSARSKFLTISMPI
jgi:hypothetical protein